MRLFRDLRGRPWGLAVNDEGAARCREALRLDLRSLLGEQLRPLARLLMDPASLSAVLYVLCLEQARRLDLGPDAFRAAVDGPPLQAAGEALTAELLGLYPDAEDPMKVIRVPDWERKLRPLVDRATQTRFDTTRPKIQRRRRAREA